MIAVQFIRMASPLKRWIQAVLFLTVSMALWTAGTCNRGIVVGTLPSEAPAPEAPAEPVGEPDPPPPEDLCDDGEDNDLDDAIDCLDTDCEGADCTIEGGCPGSCLSGTCEVPAEVDCGNALDDDCDLAVDCQDEDCADDPLCLPETVCHDGEDNDGDSAIDCDDTDCLGLVCEFVVGACPSTCEIGRTGPFCSPGNDVELVCDDTLDNDCDAGVDCADIDCTGETCPIDGCAFPGSCSDGTCEPAFVEDCFKLGDEDCDGFVDCDDPECFGPCG